MIFVICEWAKVHHHPPPYMKNGLGVRPISRPRAFGEASKGILRKRFKPVSPLVLRVAVEHSGAVGSEFQKL